MRWIHSPAVDLGLFSFSWLGVYLLIVFWPLLHGQRPCEVYSLGTCSSVVIGMYAVSNYLFRLHRHYTFAIVYADRQEFLRHSRLYTWLPAGLVAVLLPVTFYKLFSGPLRGGLHLGLTVLSAVAGAWSLWHIVLQKYGLIRLYSAKLGHGDARAEFGMLISWLCVSLTALVKTFSSYFIPLVLVNAPIGIDALKLIVTLLSKLVWLALPFAAYYTGRFFRVERANFSRASIPKLVFTGMTLTMLATIPYSLVNAYIAAGVNHSLEYIAFVNIYGPRKPGLTYWSARPIISNALIIGFVGVLYWLMQLDPLMAVSIVVGYSTLISLTHFTFDSVLWKLREESRREVLLSH